MNVTELFEELDKYFDREAMLLNDPTQQQKIVTYVANEGVRVSIDNEVHNCIFQVCCLILEDELWIYFVQRNNSIKVLFDGQDIEFSRNVTDFLSISANRPYLLENETTDILVNLFNGFGVPLENKDILVKKILFEDMAITGKKNNNWTNYSNRLTVTTTDEGTLLEKGSSNGYYLVNNSAFVYSDYVCEFDIVDLKGQCYWYHQASSSSTQDVINFASYYVKGKHIKVVCNDGTLKVYADGNQIGSDISLTTSTPFEMGFRINTHQTDERYFKFKNFVVSNDYNLKTDSTGLATLYNMNVTENTVFRALYQNEKAECEVKYCIKYYNGTISINEYNEKMTSYSASTITVDYTGTLIETDASLISRTYLQLPFLNDTNYREVPLCYEMDIIDAPTNFALCFPIKTSDDTILYWSSQSGKYGHIKLIITSEKAEYYLDGVRQWGTTSSQIPVSSRLYLQSTKSKGNGRIKIKNLAIYRI